MKNNRRILVLIGLLALAFGASAWAEELKVGVIEPQKVLEGSKEGRQIKDVLAEYVRTRQRLLDSEAEDLKTVEDDLTKQGASLSPEAKQEKEERLRQGIAAYQRRVQEFEREVQTKKAAVLGEFNKRIEQVVRAIAEKEMIFLVMEKGDNGIDALVLFNDPSVDLTDRVIKELDGKKGD